MEYRKLPRGPEAFSVLGLGMGGIHAASDGEIESVVRRALERGVNYFDLCASDARVFAPFGRAIAGRRDQVFFPLHFGAVYNDRGEYAWSRDLNQIRETAAWELETIGTDHADFGFLHCVDEPEDMQKLTDAGVLDLLRSWKRHGMIRRIGFSSHTPALAESLLDQGLADLLMFSINPAYDFERGDEYGIGTSSERTHLFRRCQAEGVGIVVMKPFHGGQLLDAKTSPFHRPLTRVQCIQYALDRPGVLTVVPGVRSLADLDELLRYEQSGAEERDYSAVGDFTAADAAGSCVYCNHCQPCPAGIDVGLVNKYYDLARAGDRIAAGHYEKLAVNAEACRQCGHCSARCPFRVDQQGRMREIAAYFAVRAAGASESVSGGEDVPGRQPAEDQPAGTTGRTPENGGTEA